MLKRDTLHMLPVVPKIPIRGDCFVPERRKRGVGGCGDPVYEGTTETWGVSADPVETTVRRSRYHGCGYRRTRRMAQTPVVGGCQGTESVTTTGLRSRLSPVTLRVPTTKTE
jgi:hypothetical protein